MIDSSLDYASYLRDQIGDGRRLEPRAADARKVMQRGAAERNGGHTGRRGRKHGVRVLVLCGVRGRSDGWVSICQFRVDVKQ